MCLPFHAIVESWRNWQKSCHRSGKESGLDLRAEPFATIQPTRKAGHGIRFVPLGTTIVGSAGPVENLSCLQKAQAMPPLRVPSGCTVLVRPSWSSVRSLLPRSDMSLWEYISVIYAKLWISKDGSGKNYVRNRSVPLALNLMIHFMTHILCPLGTTCHHFISVPKSLIYCRISKPHRESSDFEEGRLGKTASLSGKHLASDVLLSEWVGQTW